MCSDVSSRTPLIFGSETATPATNATVSPDRRFRLLLVDRIGKRRVFDRIDDLPPVEAERREELSEVKGTKIVDMLNGII
jgi:hypothetical protein